ncbi:ANL family adenylate-forming protein, partial [Pseudonocardia pini]|uniref:ANL family adenylate-forming protein n=1 Tax=Pseudonocardia pini TaxID=2758030 RepID=UPI0015F05F0D
VELDLDGAVRVVGGAVTTSALTSPATAIEMLTSGTTGPPKRVRLSVAQLNGSLTAGGRTPSPHALLSRSVSLVATPMVHIGGLWGAVGTLYAGRRIVMLRKFAVEPWARAVETYRVRAAGLVPAAIRAVLDADVAPERLASLQVVTAGTTACPPELAQRFFDRYGVRVLSIYGATEFAGAVAGWTYPLHERWWGTKAGSAGRPFPGVAMRVTADGGRPLSSGEVGRLEVRTAQSPRGAQEWMPTSDLARIDTDGFLWITGRADDTIVRGGFKIQPDTVKRVLESHAAVREAAVAALPDERLGAVPVAAVEVEAGRRRPTVEELLALCRTELTPYEIPKHLLVLDALPRSPSSKVSRVDLLDLIREAVDAGDRARTAPRRGDA